MRIKKLVPGFLYSDEAPSGKMFTDESEFMAALDDGWADSPKGIAKAKADAKKRKAEEAEARAKAEKEEAEAKAKDEKDKDGNDENKSLRGPGRPPKVK